MSLKPPKKGDVNKNWMQPRRDSIVQIRPEYHLIVTEGTDTEPAYFNAMKDEINLKFRGRIQLDIEGKGDNTLSLAKKARSSVQQSPNQYQHVWIVYDTDDFPAEHIDQTLCLCKEWSTDDTKYHALWSNQCIELWFLLHFSYMQSDIHRTAYWPKLTKKLIAQGAGEYTKGRPDMYSILKPRMKGAIKNAQKLAQKNADNLPSQSAPGTRVFELVEILLPYLDL